MINSTHQNKEGRSGYTLLEVLIAIVIMSMLIVLAITAFPNLLTRRSLDRAAQETITLLGDARARTLASRELSEGSNEGNSYGVYLDNADGELEMFSGSSYDAANTIKTIKLGRTISIATDFGDEVSFRRLTGEANQTGTITITESRSGDVQTISVLSSGLVQ